MKRNRITIETRELLVVRSARGCFHRWCESCGEHVQMVRAEQAAILAGLGLRALCDLADAGILHFNVGPDGLLLICFKSLKPSIQI